MQARRGGAAPPRDAREVDSAIGRLTYEHGGADALETVLSRLPWRDLVRAREVCRVWRDAASRDAPWKAHCDALFFAPVPGYHVRVARWDIGAVPAHAKALHAEGWFARAFSETVANRARTWLTAEELSSLSWSFRFKKCAGMEHFDEWWRGGDAKRNVFARDGTCRLVARRCEDDDAEGEGASGATRAESSAADEAPPVPRSESDSSDISHGWAFAADVYGESASLFDPDDGAHAERLAAARAHPTSCWSATWAAGLRTDPKDAHYHRHWRQTAVFGWDEAHAKRNIESGARLEASHGAVVASLFSFRSPPGFSVGSVLKVFPLESEAATLDDANGAQSVSARTDPARSARLAYPAQIVRRHERTWGWVMESCWTVAASFRMARLSDEKRNRGDLLDRYLKVRFNQQAVEVENYHNFPVTRGPHRRGVELCPEAHVRETQRMTEVTFRAPRREADADGTAKTVWKKVSVLAPAALARWIATRPWNERSVETSADRTTCLDERDALVAELAARRARGLEKRNKARKRKWKS